MSNPEPQLAQAHTRGFGCFYKSLALLFVAMLVCCGAPGTWFFAQQRHYKQQLANAVAQVRASGEPLDGAELNAYYAVPTGENDRTELYLKALSYFEDNSSLMRDPEFARIQESIAKTPPLPPDEDWPEQVAIEQLLENHAAALA